jgi:hypothetical protein
LTRQPALNSAMNLRGRLRTETSRTKTAGCRSAAGRAWVPLLPIYLRAQAGLALGRGPDAAKEFQKIVDHPGVTVNHPIAALARLGLARAAGLTGDLSTARAQYQNFFALWKDADPDLELLIEAKREYAALR